MERTAIPMMATIATAPRIFVMPHSLLCAGNLEAKGFFLAQFSFRATPTAGICDGSAVLNPKMLDTRPNLQL